MLWTNARAIGANIHSSTVEWMYLPYPGFVWLAADFLRCLLNNRVGVIRRAYCWIRRAFHRRSTSVAPCRRTRTESMRGSATRRSPRACDSALTKQRGTTFTRPTSQSIRRALSRVRPVPRRRANPHTNAHHLSRAPLPRFVVYAVVLDRALASKTAAPVAMGVESNASRR